MRPFLPPTHFVSAGRDFLRNFYCCRIDVCSAVVLTASPLTCTLEVPPKPCLLPRVPARCPQSIRAVSALIFLPGMVLLITSLSSIACQSSKVRRRSLSVRPTPSKDQGDRGPEGSCDSLGVCVCVCVYCVQPCEAASSHSYVRTSCARMHVCVIDPCSIVNGE